MIVIPLNLFYFVDCYQTMGFADLSIADIATEYDISVEIVFYLCEQLGVTYKDQYTNLALEDAKAIISLILSKQSESSFEREEISS